MVPTCAKVVPTEPESGPETTYAFELHSDASRSNSADAIEFGPELSEMLADWIAYKAERREAYKPTGLRMLLSRVRNFVAEHGEQAVSDALTKAMANNWQGWDFLGKSQPTVGRTAGRRFAGESFDPQQEIRHEL